MINMDRLSVSQHNSGFLQGLTTMEISNDKVVTFHYQLRNEQNEPLESSHDGNGEPVAYLHGHGNIVPGLEKAMAGRQAGESFEVSVAPEEGYGLRKEGAVQRVPVKHLLGDRKQNAKLKPGMVVSINTEQGARQVVVVKAGKFNVDVDVNHPLAGQSLKFEIDIQEVREASDEERAHGHAHGPGGHHH